MSDDTRKQNITVCFWTEQQQILAKAAEKKRQTMADYIRDRLVPIAAKDAGVPLPELPRFAPRRKVSSVVNLAAESLNMSRAEFQRMAVEKAAQSILDELTKPNATVPRPLAYVRRQQ